MSFLGSYILLSCLKQFILLNLIVNSMLILSMISNSMIVERHQVTGQLFFVINCEHNYKFYKNLSYGYGIFLSFHYHFLSIKMTLCDPHFCCQ